MPYAFLSTYLDVALAILGRYCGRLESFQFFEVNLAIMSLLLIAFVIPVDIRPVPSLLSAQPKV
jgi:hypothetical protein